MPRAKRQQQTKQSSDNIIFTLDIGTRSIIGLTGTVVDGRLKVTAIEKAEHTKRAMLDGQIENIDEVARLAALVKERLEKKLGVSLKKVCVATAGRALRTEKASYELEIKADQRISDDIIRRLEAGAIGLAEESFDKNNASETKRQFFLVGYSVTQYYLDDYPISSLKDHHGSKIKADIIATFLPSEVVESLYTTMQTAGLEVSSLTLEPIAAINAAIPQNLRLLNLALVDIGAGTSDIAVCRDGNITGYTMATVAGDEITETLMKQYLVDFSTAEQIKFDVSGEDDISYHDILGFEYTVSCEEVMDCINRSSSNLCKEICERIVEVNGSAPSAIFLAGGGSQLSGLKARITDYLNMDKNRVAIAGNNFSINAFSEEYDLNNPEYTTPLGIAVSAGLNLINNSFHILLNGKQAKLFRSGALSILDILMMNGYRYQDLFGHSGQNVIVSLNEKQIATYGGHATPAVLLLNGKAAKVTDTVKAGDNIEFLPAQHGKDAEITVADLVGWSEELIVKINGEMAAPNTLLHTGDVVTTHKMPDEPVQDISPLEAATPESSVSEASASETSSSMPDAMEVSKAETFASESSPPVKLSNHAEPTHKMPENETVAAVPKSNVPTKKQSAMPITYHFKLNDRTLSLPRKNDGNKYYLMDMLEYSELDFEHLSGNVILEVNGQPSSFYQELKDNDSITICEVPLDK